MNKRTYLPLPMFVLFSSSLTPNLVCRDKQQDIIGQEIRDVIKETTPPDAIMTDTTQIDKNPYRAVSIRAFQSSEDWKEYAECVTKNLTGRYKLIATEENVHFRRSLTGDILDLQIRNSSINPLHVHVTFVARPN